MTGGSVAIACRLMRFCVNVSILFNEHPLLERLAKARDSGFDAVELWWPSGEDLGEVETAIRDAGLEVALFNFDAGDMPAGDRGLLSDPERQDRFRDNVPVALELAQRLGCRKLNALVGQEIPGLERDEQLELAREQSYHVPLASLGRLAERPGERRLDRVLIGP